MKLECRKYSSDYEILWNNFVENDSINGTFLHARSFFNHNSLNEKEDHSFLFFKKNKLVAVLPAAIYLNDKSKILHSHPRATYGGFVVSTEVGVEESLEMVEQVIDDAKRNKVAEIIVRNPFRIFYKSLADETDYAMWHHGFQVKFREIESAIFLDQNAKNNYQNGAKYNIKKAWKSVTVKECDLYDEFWEMLTNNLIQKHNSKPTHTIDQFNFLRQLVGSDKIKLFGGFINGAFVCGVLIFIFSPLTIHAQYIASNPDFQDVRPLNAVIDYLVDWGMANNFRYFNLGTANEDQGKKINLGLFHFKEGFGARGTLRETMHFKLL